MSVISRTALLASMAACALVLVACGGDGSGDGNGNTTSDSPDIKVSPAAGDAAIATQGPEAASSPTANVTDEAVRFETADGVVIHGHLYSSDGPKRKVVVLAHEFPRDQTAWRAFAQELAGRGIHALTFDFRGYGETGGSREVSKFDRDLESAVRFIRSRDYAQVYVFGASIGGTAAIKVASRLDLAGVATLSAPAAFQGLDARNDVRNVMEKKLFMAARGNGDAPAALDYFNQNAPGARTTRLFDGTAHGTELLSGASGDEVRQLLLEFLN